MLAAIESLFPTLPRRHLRALDWFSTHAGHVVRWPQPLEDGTLLASKAKGIFKPAWSAYALSVRQSLLSPYPDLDPETRSDGTWWYEYFQENDDPSARDREYTNRALLACMRDGIPIGVLRQVEPKPRPRYHVLGLARVMGWDGGYFFLDSFQPHVVVPILATGPALLSLEPPEHAAYVATGDLLVEARERVSREIVQRRGQHHFRKTLLSTYAQVCAVTDCDAPEALEAAHILPYRGAHTNHPSNGLLLRADIHTLFDLGLVTVETERMGLELAEELRNTVYSRLEGQEVRRPLHLPFAPSREALSVHREWAHAQHVF